MKLESDNHEATFSVVKAPDWINVIALTPENNIVLVEQYRYGIEEPTLELPGGMVDPGEHPEATSIRELKEETGYAGSEVINLGKVSSNPAMLSNYTHTYLIKNCEKVGDQELDGNERIKVQVMPWADFLDLVRHGAVHHALVVAAVTKYLISSHYKE